MSNLDEVFKIFSFFLGFFVTTMLSASVVQVLDGGITFSNPQGFVVSPDGSLLYVVNTDNSSVSIVDTSNSNILRNIDDTDFGFSQPVAMAITSDGTKAYVLNNGNQSVSVVDLTQNKVTHSLQSLFFNDAIVAVAIGPDDTYAYVVNNIQNNVSIIDVANNVVLDNPVNDPDSTLNGPVDIAIDSAGYAYVVNNGGNTVSIIDVTNDQINGIVSAADVSTNIFGMAIIPNSFNPQRAYVINDENSGVLSINLDTNIQIGTITDLNPASIVQAQSIACIPDGTRAYVVNNYSDSYGATGSVSIIDTAINTVTGFVQDLSPATFKHPVSIAISLDGLNAYVGNFVGQGPSWYC